MKVSAPTLLGFNGGFVDTAGYLALQGLFAAHVTGNFVAFGASLVQDAFGAVAKLLAARPMARRDRRINAPVSENWRANAR
jgi:uncharacterized membrane protein YoaK (UPF0700 family)